MEWSDPIKNPDGSASQQSGKFTVMWLPNKEKATGNAAAFHGHQQIAVCYSIPLDQRELQRAAIRCMRALCGQYQLAGVGEKPAAEPRGGGSAR